jgi:hypothetical protein
MAAIESRGTSSEVKEQYENTKKRWLKSGER